MVEPKNLALLKPPSLRRWDGGMAKIWSAGDGHYLYLHTQFGEDPCTQFRVIVVTDAQINTQTGAITIHCAAALLACSVTRWALVSVHMATKGSANYNIPWSVL